MCQLLACRRTLWRSVDFESIPRFADLILLVKARPPGLRFCSFASICAPANSRPVMSGTWQERPQDPAKSGLANNCLCWPTLDWAPTRSGHTLGAGGMGEVYRARDTRLNRDVAIKVLREDDAASVESRSRFEREARAIAALNHPNIVAVYDFGVEADQQYIVSELVEGESLRALLTGKPVPIAQTA